jgi:hypothetical protein
VSSTVYAVDVSEDNEGGIEIEKKIITENTNIYSVDIKIPCISGMADKEKQNALNEEIEKRIIQEKDAIILKAGEFAKDCELYEWSFTPYKYKVDYKLHDDGCKSNYLSLCIRTYNYLGGDSGNISHEIYNIDLNTGDEVTISNFFEDNSYINDINNKIYNLIDERKQQGHVFYEEYAKFEGIDVNQKFYLKDGKLCVLFESGEIAPVLEGTVEFEVITLFDFNNFDGLPKLIINDEEQNKSPLKNDNGVLMLPFRCVVEKLGYRLVWIGDIKMIVIYKNDKWATVTIGENTYANNFSDIIKLEHSPELIGSSTYIPINFFSEILNVKIETDENGNINIL